MQARLPRWDQSKNAAFIVGILLFITVPLFLGSIREITKFIRLGPVQEIEAIDGSLHFMGEGSSVKIGGYPLAEIAAPPYRTAPTGIPVELALWGHVLLVVLARGSVIVAALSVAQYFHKVSEMRILTIIGASNYFRRASLSLLLALIILPFISYFFYDSTVGNSSLNLGILLLHLAAIFFLEFFGRLLEESVDLKEEAEQFL